VTTLFVDKERGVRDRGDEAQGADVAGEALVPRPRGLLESIQGLLQQADMIWRSWVDKTRRLLAVDRLLQMAMKKSILHVELMDGPGARDGEAEDDPYRGWFDNWTEGLVVVDAVLLQEPANNPPGLVSSEGAIGVVLVLEDPLAGDDISMRRSRNKPPGVVVDERLVLVNHRSAPIWVG